LSHPVGVLEGFFFTKKIRFSLINIRLGLRKMLYTCGKIGDTLPKHYRFCSRRHSLNGPRGKLSAGIHVILLLVLFCSVYFMYLMSFFTSWNFLLS